MSDLLKKLFVELLGRFDEPGDIEARHGPGIPERFWVIFEAMATGQRPVLSKGDEDLYEIIISLPSGAEFLREMDVAEGVEFFDLGTTLAGKG